MSSTTVLRVKRPRHVAPVPVLTFQGKKRPRVDEIADLVEALGESTVKSEADSSKRTTNHLVWKRKETALEPHQAVSFITKRSLTCVDAILEGESSSKKQRLLTLVQESPSSSPAHKKQRRATIMNPAARLVKESLEMVQAGNKTVLQHLNYIEQDPGLSLDCKMWILVECEDGSNILHLCALFNDVEMCRRLCMVYSSHKFLEHSDHSHQRPYQVALSTSHVHVAEVLEAFGADTSDFVYDIYHLHKGVMEEEDDIKQHHPLRVDLSGGVGYWNEFGELILEALCPEDFGEADSLKYDDDDEDSNAEDADANDYPDEENESGEDNGSDYDDKYRHIPIYNMPEGTQTSYISNGYIHDDDHEYDAQYGLYESSGGAAEPRIFAYDSSHDDDNEGID